jgi:hypothetical protein
MGQAKRRGSTEERAALAIALIDSIKPKFIVCNNCEAEIADVHVMDSRGMIGITGAFAGICSCGHTTWAMAGDPAAVASAMSSLRETMGAESILGTMLYQRT